MQDLRNTIQRYLDNAKQPNSMRDLFCQTLSWGKATGAGQTLPVGAPVNQTLTARPVAQLGTLPVFRIDWPEAKLPNAPADERAAIAALAQKCLDAKGQGAKVKEWEAEIDERVARLYGLDKADLKAIKGDI